MLLSKDLRNERWEFRAALENDISDACREIHAHLERLTSRGGWRLADASGSLAAASNGGDAVGTEPVTGLLRAIASERRDLTPWIPYWRMTGLGGRLAWSWPLDNPSTPPREATAAKDLHSWLYPGTGGWGVLTEGRLRP